MRHPARRDVVVTRATRTLAAAAAALLCAVLAAGCGGSAAGSGATGQAPATSAPTGGADQLAHMRQLVDGAQSAADSADSEAAADG